MDFVTAAQAAHWFDRKRTREEFVRILKPQGWLVLLWNERLTDTTPFLRDYEQLLLTFGTDYEDVRHERTTDAVNEFFDPAPFQERVFAMRQEFDYAGLEAGCCRRRMRRGRDIRSMNRCCRNCGGVFDEQREVEACGFDYKTRVYFGKLKCNPKDKVLAPL